MSGLGVIRSVREQVADNLRDDIFCGRLAEGERVSEASLAKRFRVGRGPIREALLQLTHEGLLRSKPNCGVTVAPAAPDAVRDLILPTRRTVETYALKLIYDGLTDADFKAWDETLRRMDHACREGDLTGILLADLGFHRSILVRADQPDLLAIWQVLVGRVRGHFWDVVREYADLTAIHADHRKLVDTFRAGSKDAAVQALADHIW